MTFKEGDIVVCIEASTLGYGGEVGKQYKVIANPKKDVSAPPQMLEGVEDSAGFSHERFALVRSALVVTNLAELAAVGSNTGAPSNVKPLGVNPKDLMGVKKARISLVPPAATIYTALAMEDGATKYGPYNWRENKVKASIYIEAAQRHLMSYQDGEECAQDSKKPHLAHALACLAILVDAIETGNVVDDRPKPGAASNLIAKWEKKSPGKTEKEGA